MLILRTVAEAASFELLIEGVNPDLWGRYTQSTGLGESPKIG
jgi:hypothetical protein